MPGNAICCDCGAPEPQWASVTLASLVCIQCAGSHRALGVKKSRIRSLQMDSWSRTQVVRMLMGGNSRLKSAFVTAGENFDGIKLLDRYSGSVAADYVASLNAKCPNSVPCTPTKPKKFWLDDDITPQLRQRVKSVKEPLGTRVPSSDSLEELNRISSMPELHSITSAPRTYCPCSSSRRWMHVPSIAGKQRKMPIHCGGATHGDKSCIVSSFEKLKIAVLRICPGANSRSESY